MRLGERLRKALRGDGILVFLFLLLTAAYLIGATQLRGGLLSEIVGPRTFPYILGALALGLCALFFAQKLRDGAGDETDLDADAEDGETVWTALWALRPLFLLLAYVVVMTTLGFLLATFLYVTLTVKQLGQRTWWASALFAAGLTAVIFVLFSYAFEVRLPPGVVLPSPY